MEERTTEANARSNAAGRILMFPKIPNPIKPRSKTDVILDWFSRLIASVIRKWNEGGYYKWVTLILPYA